MLWLRQFVAGHSKWKPMFDPSLACWSAGCVKGFLSFKPSRFYPCHSERDNFKAVRGFGVWKFCLVLCLQNVWFIVVKKLVTFGYVVGRFYVTLWGVFMLCCGAFFCDGNLSWFGEFLNSSANESKTLFVVQTVTMGKGVGGVAQESECRRAEGDD